MTADDRYKLWQIAEAHLAEAAWIWVSTDGSDRLFTRFLTTKASATAYAVCHRNLVQLVVSSLDSDIDFGMETQVYSGQRPAPEVLRQILQQTGWPATIYLNFSRSGDPKVDSIGHGVFLALVETVEGIYQSHGQHRPTFESAEELVYALVESRSPAQIERTRIAARRAEAIIRASLGRIRPGMSERDIFRIVQGEMAASQAVFCGLNGVKEESHAWDAESCPVVLVGPNLQKGGHAETSDYRIQPGETVYIDFGVCLTFDDGSTASSDLQRMGYLPREGERGVPHDVQHVFDTLVEAISEGMARLRPGMVGHKVDEIVRGVVTRGGYPSYDHSTGHPIAEVAHSPGTLFGLESNPRARRAVRNLATYTIEPRCQVPNGGSIEEMVLVTEEGAVPLCEPQRELFVIR